jgi:ribosomal-protein-alanine N-acetyltransferase
MNSQYIIREFRENDLEPVIDINKKCLPENYAPWFFMEHYNQYPKAFLVAECKGIVVGYIMCRVEYGFSNHKLGVCRKGHIVSIAVLPEYRRKGIGEDLLKEAMKALRTYQASEVYLEVRVSNKPAINLYKKLGFLIVRILRAYYMDGEDAFCMSRSLLT